MGINKTLPFELVQCTSNYIKDIEDGKELVANGALYFVTDTKKILLGKNNELVSMGKSSGVIYGAKDTDLKNLEENVEFTLDQLEEGYRDNYPQADDLIFNKDGCFYRVLEVDVPHIKTKRLTVAGGGGGAGGGGSSSSSVLLAVIDTPATETLKYGDPCILKYEFYATTDGVASGTGVREIFINDTLKERKNIPQSTKENRAQAVDITKYLEAGENYIQIKCSDVYGNYKILQFTRTVVKLEIDDNTLTSNGTKRIISTDTTTFEYSYVPKGIGDKTITYVLKNAAGDLISTESEVFSDSGVGHVKKFTDLDYGVYTLDVSMTAEVNGTELIPVTAHYIIMCVANEPNPQTELHKPLLASYLAMAAENTEIQEVPQGKQIELAYMMNDPGKKTNAEIKLVVKYRGDDNVLTTYSTSATRLTNSLDHGVWDTRNYPIGQEVYFSIGYAYKDMLTGQDMFITSNEWKIKVVKSDVETDVVSTNTILQLTANGRSNTDSPEEREKWTYFNDTEGEITTTFSNVNWVNDTQSGTGWIMVDKVPALRLSGESVATINCHPFSFKSAGSSAEVGYNLIESGFTIELDFAIRDVNNHSAVAMSCMYDKVGFEVSANKVLFRSAQNVEVTANYNDNERIKVTFVVESNKKTAEGNFVTTRLASIYLNGVLTSSKQYPAGETFSQAIPAGITIGSKDCCIDVYNIRIYKKALTSKEIVNNFIYDMTDPVEQTKAYERNKIFNTENLISYSEVLKTNSVMLITGPLPTYKGDKQNVDIDYNCLFDKTLSFSDSGSIDVQGTSSQFYIRKNWKIKCKSKHLLDQNQIENKVFCMKADYADSTSTHNTQHANLIHYLYEEPTIAQMDDPRCRTTVYGYPVVMFHRATTEDTPTFIGKYNFNFDKGSEEVFGFTDDYEVECWEFCNNDSDACNFKGPVPLDWSEDFEPRYMAPFKINEGEVNELEISWDRIEELQKKTSLTSKEQEEIQIQRTHAIDNFKQMHNWVRSTDPELATNRSLLDEFGIEKYIDKDGNEHTIDDRKYRLAIFKDEFEDYFDFHYCLVYYLYTFVNLMVDQRAKNMFLTYWGPREIDGKIYGGKWQPWLYDNDTCFGINNSGEIKYLYYHEDTDVYQNVEVYNGYRSVLWNNFRECYPDEIQELYRSWRSKNNAKISYSIYKDRFITEGSDKWGETVYNEDTDYKYIEPLRSGNYNEDGEWVANDASHLKQIQGTGEEYLRYFIDKRLNYCDSKWHAGSFPDSIVELRVQTPPEWGNITPNHDLTLTPFETMYVSMRYKANGKIQKKFAHAGQPVTFSPILTEDENGNPTPGGTFNDTEVGIFGAPDLSSLGDLSACYCRKIDISKANKLVELIAGNETDGYFNSVLTSVNVGANKLLRKLNLGNCTSLTNELDLGNCPNIGEIYLFGTNIETIVLPESGHITHLHLPASLTSLTLKNQFNIQDFQIKTNENDGLIYKNLRKVLINNCPSLQTQDMIVELVNTFNSINAAKAEDEEKENLFLGFGNINWTFDTPEFLLSLLDNPNIGCIDLNSANTYFDGARQITGTCHIKTLNGLDMERIKNNYSSDLKITYDNLTADVNFYIGGEPLEEGEQAYYHYKYKVNDEIPKTELNSFKYFYINNSAQDVSSSLINEYFTTSGNISRCKKNVEVIRNLTEPFKIYSKTVQGGSNCRDPLLDNLIETPKRYPSDKYTYEFSGWSFTPGGAANATILEDIEQNTNAYATFIKTIRSYPVYFYNDPLEQGGKDPVLEYVGDSAINYGEGVPYAPETQTYPVDGLEQDYTFVRWEPDPSVITGPTNCNAKYAYTAFSPIRLVEREIVEFESSDNLISVGDYAFYNSIKLETVNLPKVTSIGASAFEGCSKLSSLTLLCNEVCSLGANALKDTSIAKGQGNIYVNDNQVTNYKEDDQWKNYKNYINSILEKPQGVNE